MQVVALLDNLFLAFEFSVVAILNIGGGEFLAIAIIALIAVGPEQLPVVLRKAGKVVAQIKGVTEDLRSEFMSNADGMRSEIDELNPKNWLRGTGAADDPIVPKIATPKLSLLGDDSESPENQGDDIDVESEADAQVGQPEEASAALEEGTESEIVETSADETKPEDNQDLGKSDSSGGESK